MLLIVVAAAAGAHSQNAPPLVEGGEWREAAEEIFARVNQARAQQGLEKLEWDASLAAAALEHCRRMAAEGEIEHRYTGEPALAERTASAGARFNLVEENIGTGPTAARLHEEWMNSPGHRANLLNPRVNRVGIVVVLARGTLYAVEDFSRAVEKLNPEELEERVSSQLRAAGVVVLADREQARSACAMEKGVPTGVGSDQPLFVARWQSGSLDRLPDVLVAALQSKQYRRAAVGSCAAKDVAMFSAFRLAVLLY